METKTWENRSLADGYTIGELCEVADKYQTMIQITIKPNEHTVEITPWREQDVK